MGIGQLIDLLARKPTVSKCYCQIPPKNVLDEGFVTEKFAPDKAYFEIRLPEMFLRDKREYTREFIPLSVAMTEFLYSGDTRSIPFFVGNNLLQRIENYTGKEYIEYRNTRIVGPIPYSGDDVSLFIGLFRVQVSDLFKEFLSFVENIVDIFDVSQLSKYLNIIGSCSAGMAAMLGMKEVELRLGNRDSFTSRVGDSKQFKQCYLAYINCPSGTLSPETLWVRDDQLFVGRDADSIVSLRDYDYCLVKINHLSQRDDYTKFPFHQLWLEARELIWSGKEQEADAKMAVLGQQMAVSSDLTTTHRHDLIRLYRANFESENEAFRKSQYGRSEKTAPVRSAWRGAKASDGPTALETTAYFFDQAEYPEELGEGLLEVSRNWKEIPYLKEERSRGFQLTDDILNQQLKQLARISKIQKPDPKTLADAMAVAFMNPL